jgi:hypothetical protein
MGAQKPEADGDARAKRRGLTGPLHLREVAASIRRLSSASRTRKAKVGARPCTTFARSLTHATSELRLTSRTKDLVELVLGRSWRMFELMHALFGEETNVPQHPTFRPFEAVETSIRATAGEMVARARAALG